MKNIYISLCLLLIANVAQSQETNSKESVCAEVKFGMYSDCFRRGGICSFDLGGRQGECNAQFEYDNGMLNMKISSDNPSLKNEMSLEIKSENSEIKWSEFVVLENILIDDNLSSALDIDKQIMIPAGKYPVSLCENYVTIQFKTVPL